MSEKILFVDDEPNVLTAYTRNLRKRFNIQTAVSAEVALHLLDQEGPFAVVVSDRQMPQIDGVQFLSLVKTKSPDSVRMMLTGNADLESTIEVVNQGNLFRFLTKPCEPEVLSKAIVDALQQYRLVVAERELLEKTLSGAMQMLMEILAMVDPESFGRAQKFRERIMPIAQVLGATNRWELELAATLSQIGYVTIPPSVTRKSLAGQSLTAVEREMLMNVPEIGRKLLMNIPRLESLATMVHYQQKHYDGSGFPANELAGEGIPLGARILFVLSDYFQLESNGVSPAKAIETLRSRAGWYDPSVLEVLSAQIKTLGHDAEKRRTIRRQVKARDLQVSDLLLSDVETADGMLIVARNHHVTEALLDKIRNFDAISGIKEPITVESLDTAPPAVLRSAA